MSAVNITNVAVLDNPAPFLSPFQFEISYECLDALKDDLEWKITYVGSAEDETYDQLLESVFVGPVNVGKYRFVLQVTITRFNLAISRDCYAGGIEAETTLQADPPEPSKI
uniref:Probable histone chaperone ASF1A n=1 Tax=Nicotiana tabacum TaxID=4097 RepID=A0A1S4DDS1_TOBAC